MRHVSYRRNTHCGVPEYPQRISGCSGSGRRFHENLAWGSTLPAGGKRGRKVYSDEGPDRRLSSRRRGDPDRGPEGGSRGYPRGAKAENRNGLSGKQPDSASERRRKRLPDPGDQKQSRFYRLEENVRRMRVLVRKTGRSSGPQSQSQHAFRCPAAGGGDCENVLPAAPYCDPG